ncbi:arylsulfatase [Nonomuraea cavernae]|uniref:Arylsulfatase n=1 Tax=Nonomuraea cavernae TaxID=2045107 RepID=A0A918DL72_9ACTN|nr:arylsulfatase [Nonomuraea cavernae]MCA2188545.1 arylsulfatase [Nonomuraea cavernae]GGO72995.1 arylsulfatase [Nonomuraea cavernae]
MIAYEGFGGRVGRTFAGSESWWPTRPTPGPGAPNIVIVLVDDVGFGDLGCYGSEIPTPHLDELAGQGVQWTDFHVTPMCSPTRAALLTGVDPHLAGVGHIANSDPGFPGYAGELAPDAFTMAELFRAAGWQTMAVGKWHLTKDSDMSDAGPRHAWPLQRGFDRFYGFLEAFTDFHHPHRLIRDNSAVEVDRYPDGYHLTDDLTREAVAMVRQASTARTPFLLYLAHGAAHAPLQAPPGDIARHRGRYDDGWDAIRERRFARQLDLGLFPPGTELPPRNAEPGDDVPAWADLSPDRRRVFARYMEVYAAMITGIDRSVGVLRETLAELGELDNTIFVFTSDNGASREGEEHGTTQYLRTLLSANSRHDREDPAADLARLDLIGGPRTLSHYPRGWAMASNTPFRLYKRNTHAGGHAVPFLISWPAGLPQRGERRGQWGYVTDVLPTLIELTGIEAPEGRPRKGASLVKALHDAEAVHDHQEQLAELQGHRGYLRGEWEIVTRHAPLTPFGEHEWELYHRPSDPTQLRDRAAERPEKVRELAAAWEEAAHAGQVYPLDEGSRLRYLLRPPWHRAPQPVRLTPRTHTLERWQALQLVQWRSFTVEARIGAPGRGVLVAHGGQGGGYLLYVEDELVFAHNGYGELRLLHAGAPGGHIRVEVTAPGGWRWDVSVTVDGEPRGTLTGLPMLAAFCPMEGIDVGVDRRSPVSWDVYERHGPFAFTGVLDEVVYTPGDFAPDAGDNFVDLVREIGLKYE